MGGQRHFTHERRGFAHDLGGISERTSIQSGLPVEDGHLFGVFVFEFGHRLGPGDAAQSLALQHRQFKLALGGLIIGDVLVPDQSGFATRQQHHDLRVRLDRFGCKAAFRSLRQGGVQCGLHRLRQHDVADSQNGWQKKRCSQPQNDELAGLGRGVAGRGSCAALPAWGEACVSSVAFNRASRSLKLSLIAMPLCGSSGRRPIGTTPAVWGFMSDTFGDDRTQSRQIEGNWRQTESGAPERTPRHDANPCGDQQL